MVDFYVYDGHVFVPQARVGEGLDLISTKPPPV